MLKVGIFLRMSGYIAFCVCQAKLLLEMQGLLHIVQLSCYLKYRVFKYVHTALGGDLSYVIQQFPI